MTTRRARIAILGSAEGWHVRDLFRAAAAESWEGPEVVVAPFDQVRSEIRAEAETVWSGNINLSTCHGVLVRAMPAGSLEQIIFRMDALHALQRQGTVVVNSPRALETAIDKYLTLSRLRTAGFLVPDTIVCQGAPEAIAAFETLGCDCVVKP
ncbi:MAG TPA: hypothetical protein VIY86_14985, partial [Pirellulaceae bacterium]